MLERNRPPRSAAWLLALFAAEPDFDTIQGDLLVEYHQRARVAHDAASRWYWRETLRTMLVFLKRPPAAAAIVVGSLVALTIRAATPAIMTLLRYKLNFASRDQLRLALVLAMTVVLGVLAARLFPRRGSLLRGGFVAALVALWFDAEAFPRYAVLTAAVMFWAASWLQDVQAAPDRGNRSFQR
jgi:hypothetical protein